MYFFRAEDGKHINASEVMCFYVNKNSENSYSIVSLLRPYNKEGCLRHPIKSEFLTKKSAQDCLDLFLDYFTRKP